MPTDRIDAVMLAAVCDGVLPEGAAASPQQARPWPVVLLTALGAWLAAIPLLAVIAMLMRDMFESGAGPYFAGAMLIAAAVVVLRARDLPVFVEQLAVPALLAGGGSLALGAWRDLPSQTAAIALCTVALGVAWAVPRAWLRVLLGAAASVCASMIVLPSRAWDFNRASWLPTWLALHAPLLAILAALFYERRLRSAAGARMGAALESVAAGWLVADMVMLSWWSGMTFVAGGVLGSDLGAALGGTVAHELSPASHAATWVMRGGSVLLAIAAMLVLAARWPSVRHVRGALVAAIIAALCGFMTTLGAVLLALACAAVTRRWRVAVVAAIAAAWIVGAFYYRLDWTLATKALVLVTAGALLAAIAWAAQSRARFTAGPRAAVASASAAWIAAGAAVTLAFVNYAIHDKEELIAHGDKVFVQLAPVDPRSLMQGDYMRLNYRLPAAAQTLGRMPADARPFVVVKRDARGVGEPIRIVDTRGPLGPDEMHIELTPHAGGWAIVSDAWYFAEGDGQRWSKARYAEFRVLPDGRALLVGLADADLKAISAQP